MNKITLLSTLHDPNQRLPIIDPNPNKAFYKCIIVKTVDTPDNDELANHFLVWSLPKTGMADGRRHSLKYGLLTDSDYFLYVDYDRLVFWLNHYPDEFWQSVQSVVDHDFTIFGRTRTALLCHPIIQRLTEVVGNEIFNSAFCSNAVDILSGTRGLSRKCAEYIIERSKAQGAGIDAEWPILAEEGGFTIGSYYVNGLAWEGNGNRSEEEEVKLRVSNLQDIVDIIYD